MHSLLSGLCKRGRFHLDENEAYHFRYPRSAWTRTKHTTSILGTRSQEWLRYLFLIGRWAPCQTGEPFTDKRYLFLARTHSRPISLNARSAQSLAFFSRKQNKTISSIQTTTWERLIDLGCCFRLTKAWGPRSTPQVKNGCKAWKVTSSFDAHLECPVRHDDVKSKMDAKLEIESAQQMLNDYSQKWRDCVQRATQMCKSLCQWFLWRQSLKSKTTIAKTKSPVTGQRCQGDASCVQCGQ